jgi:hypothetical protein
VLLNLCYFKIKCYFKNDKHDAIDEIDKKNLYLNNCFIDTFYNDLHLYLYFIYSPVLVCTATIRIKSSGLKCTAAVPTNDHFIDRRV